MGVLLLLVGAWMVSSYMQRFSLQQRRPLTRVLHISPSDEDKVIGMKVAVPVDHTPPNKGARVLLAKGFGKSSTDSIEVESLSRAERTRSEKKAEYRKLASMAKRSSSLQKMLGGPGADIFQAQRKQGNRGSGGA